MLSEVDVIRKLREYGTAFNIHVRNKDWGKAHNTYRAALTIAVFMQLPQTVMEDLFGIYRESDDEVILDEAIFRKKDVARVDMECCIMRHMAYEDMALRQQRGQPARYYSDADYCARCSGNTMHGAALGERETAYR